MNEDEGTLSDARFIDAVCRRSKCASRSTLIQTWKSNCGSYVDHKYTCRECGHVWWIDGIDA
jgi:hypothetical protein